MYRVRRWLESPLLNRHVSTWSFLVVLVPISIVMALVGAARRYLLFPYFRKKTHSFRVVCVGNVAMGGTGKSPVVRQLATLFLEKGFAVAIVSRGYGSASSKPVFVTASNQTSVSQLNDENREHWFRLNHLSNRDQFIVSQNTNRLNAIDEIARMWRDKEVPVHQQLVLLDDGMQNLKTPRDIDLCVWSESSRHAPALCFPAGPYREVFFRSLSKRILFHFFSSRDLALSLKKRFRLEFDDSHAVVVTKSPLFFRVTPSVDLSQLSESQLRLEINQDDPIVCAAGISRPDEFLNSIRLFFPNVVVQLVAFADHQGQASEVVSRVSKGGQKVSVFTTEKDFYRWCLDPVFYDTIRKNQQTWYVVRLEIGFQTLTGQPFAPTALVNEANL